MKVFGTHGVEFLGTQPRVQGIANKTHTPLKTTNSLHITPAKRPPDTERVTEGFAAALGEALRRVEGLDVKSQKLNMKAVYEPDSVEAYEVVLAAEKARYALTLTKTIADGLVRTFRDLTNPR